VNNSFLTLIGLSKANTKGLMAVGSLPQQLVLNASTIPKKLDIFSFE
jgi:hypothetical protein